MQRSESSRRAADRIAAHLLKSGLATTSVRDLAAAAGVSDRMLLYYFEDKADVLASALGRVAANLAQALDEAIPAGAGLAPMMLFAELSHVVSSKRMKPYMSLWIEVVAAAARGEKPYPKIARQIAAGFLDWGESRLAPADRSRASAAMVLAMIDGLAILAACTDDKLAQQAAGRMRQLAVRPDR